MLGQIRHIFFFPNNLSLLNHNALYPYLFSANLRQLVKLILRFDFVQYILKSNIYICIIACFKIDNTCILS